MNKKRINLYGWTDRQDEQIKAVHEQLKQRGIRFEYDGKPNVSAIILYLLEDAAKERTPNN